MVDHLMVEDRVGREGDDIAHRCHDRLHLLRVQLEYTVEDSNFVVPKGLLTLAVKLEERSIVVVSAIETFKEKRE
jgi:hypothetical protein